MDLLTTDTTGAAVLVGLLAPYLIALVNQPTFTPTGRKAVAVAVSVVLGAGLATAAGTFGSGWTVLTAAATVLATSQAVYGRLFAASVAALEQATSPTRPDPGDAADPGEGGEVDPPGRHAAHTR